MNKYTYKLKNKYENIFVCWRGWKNLPLTRKNLRSRESNSSIAVSQDCSGEDLNEARFWLDSELTEAQLAGLVRIKSRNPFTIELRGSEFKPWNALGGK